MLKHRFITLMRTFLLLLLGLIFAGPALAQVPDTSNLQLVNFEHLSEYPKFRHQLRYQHRNRKKHHTIREGAVMSLAFKDGSKLPVARLKQVTAKGIYVATYGIQTQREKRWEDYPDLVYASVGLDSVIYFPLSSIQHIHYRNRWERQTDWSKSIYVGGFFVGLVPSATEALLNGELRDSTWGLVGLGLSMAAVGYFWNRQVSSLRDHADSQWKLSISAR